MMTTNSNGAGLAGILRIAISVLLVSSLVVLSVSCASSNTHRLTLWEHPLVGKLWDVNKKEFIDQAELVKQMLKAEYLLLGERHDNLVHHQHQSWIIQQLQQSRRQASVAFEMIDDKQGTLLAKHHITSVEQMIAILNQIRNHWNYEIRYKALFASVMSAGYPIMPANLNRQRLKQIVKHGEDKLPPAYKKMLVQTPLPVEHMKSLQQEIKQSHCNMLDDKAASKMILAQRVRDAVIAHSLTKNRAPTKVLIAGAGHVRKDRGVPLYLANQVKAARTLTVGFIEVSDGENDVTRYAEPWSTHSLPFDFVWFTPQVDRVDLCAKFKALHKAQTSTTSP